MDRRQIRLRIKHVPDAAKLLLRNPSWLKEYLRVMRGQQRTERAASVHDAVRVPPVSEARAVSDLLDISEAEYRSAVGSLWKPEPPDAGPLSDWNAREDLQNVVGAVVRLTKPEVVVETGVAMGMTSAVILAALAENGRGHLHSIDLPALQAKPEDFVGRAVPERLRERWTLELGPSRQLLPGIATAVAPIDLTLHDADHSHEGQLEEYRTVWPHLRSGGVLVSDDVRGPAFVEFADEVDVRPHLVAEAEDKAPVGILRKP